MPLKTRSFFAILVLLISLSSQAENPKHRRDRLVPPTRPVNKIKPIQAEENPNPTQSNEESSEILPVSNAGNSEIPASEPNCEQKHSIEALMQIPSHHSPQADPFGGVYFISDLRDVPQVFHLEKPRLWPTQLSFFASGTAYFKVSPDGEKILLATHEGGNEQYDIYLLEIKSNKLTPLLVDPKDRIESVAWSESSNWFAYTSNSRNKKDMDLYQFDLKAKKSTLLSEMVGHHSVKDISPDDQWISLTRFVSVTDADVLLYHLPESKLLNMTEHTNQLYSDSALFTKDSKGIFYLSDKDNGIVQIYFNPFKKGGQSKLLTQGKWGIEEFILDPSRSLMAYQRNEEGYSVFEGFDIDRSGQKRRPFVLPNLEKSVSRGFSFTNYKTKKTLFFSSNSSTTPPAIYSWNQLKKSKWTPDSTQLLRDQCFGKETLVRYPSFDKLEIPAFLYLPNTYSTQKNTQPIPFIVFIHGGPESQFRPGFSKIFQYFLERGYGVFAPNVRGSFGYGRDYLMLDNYKKRMDSVNDALEGAKWLVNQRYAKSSELGVFGGSYGGFMVLAMLTENPDLFSAASENVGIANFETFLKNTSPYRRALREIEYGPLSDTAFLKSISPIFKIDKIKTPLIVFHGANDPRVPVNEAEQIINALKEREIPVEFKIFQDEGHGNAKLRNILEQASQMIFFFEKQFKAKKN